MAKQVKMTDEIRAKLLGYTIVSGSVIVNYTIEIEGVPEEYLSKFKLKTFTIDEIEKLRTTELTTDTEDFFNELIRSHILGWTIYDPSIDEFVKYKGDDNGCDKDLYDKLPNTVKLDILQYLTRTSVK